MKKGTKRKPKPAAAADKWTAPDWLNEIGRAEFDRIVARLTLAGRIDKVEVVAVEQYCRNYQTWRKAESWIDENGHVAVSRNDKGEVRNVAPVPQIQIAAKAQTAMRQFLNDCGLTPTADSKIETEGETLEQKKARLIREMVGGT